MLRKEGSIGMNAVEVRCEECGAQLWVDAESYEYDRGQLQGTGIEPPYWCKRCQSLWVEEPEW